MKCKCCNKEIKEDEDFYGYNGNIICKMCSETKRVTKLQYFLDKEDAIRDSKWNINHCKHMIDHYNNEIKKNKEKMNCYIEELKESEQIIKILEK